MGPVEKDKIMSFRAMSFSAASKSRRFVGVMLSAALLAGSATPAMAQSWGGGYNSGHSWGSGWSGSGWRNDRYRDRYRHYRHRDRGLNAGDVIGIAALIGAVAVIASSASKDKRAKQPDYREYPDAPSYPAPSSYPTSNQGSYPAAGGTSAWSSDSAIDACISAVRARAEDERGYAEIVDVAEPRVNGQDGWSIDGRVEQRSSYRSNDGQTRRFSCDVRGGQVAEVYLSRDFG